MIEQAWLCILLQANQWSSGVIQQFSWSVEHWLFSRQQQTLVSETLGEDQAE